VTDVDVVLGDRAIRVLLFGLELLRRELRKRSLKAPAELARVDRSLRAALATGVSCRLVSGSTDAPRTVSSMATTFTLDDAAEATKLSRRTIERRVAAGEIASVKIGRARRVPADELARVVGDGQL
jgi:excisionase family DNA binding protein